MSVFFPDNGKRQVRMSELATDAGHYLQLAQQEYTTFTTVIAELNAQIAALYRQAGVAAPAESNLDILAAADIAVPGAAGTAVIKVSESILGVTAFSVTTRYLAPGVLSRIVATGALSEEAVAATFVTAWGGELTVGVLITGIATAVVAGLIITAIGLAFDLFEGASLRDELRHGIAKLCQIRADICLNWLRAKKLVDGMQSVRNSLLNLAQQGLLTPAAIENAIQRDVLPVVAEVEGMSMADAQAELSGLDRERGAWTNEDTLPVAPVAPSPPNSKPTFAVALVRPTPPLMPGGLILCPSVPGVWTPPTERYPSIRKGDLTVWPFSFSDHRNAINVTIFDKAGAIVNQWILNGISTVTKIHADPDTNMVCFTGDGGAIVHMTWSQIAPAPPQQPVHGDVRDMLELLPATADFGVVGIEPVFRPVMVRNKSSHPLRVRLQIISALAADPNDPQHGSDPKPAVAWINLGLKVLELEVPPNSTTEVSTVSQYRLPRWWDVYSPSDFEGGVGAQAMDLTTGALCGGAVTTWFRAAWTAARSSRASAAMCRSVPGTDLTLRFVPERAASNAGAAWRANASVRMSRRFPVFCHSAP
ncbi:hypothetical protein QIH80_24555 [Bradyrhizobium elkanii]|nr:hypothetical protein QIH80_24555 [Bradyrhizobium elkanii]